MIVVGVMSGTSADGVDVSVVDITGRGHGLKISFLGHYARPYSPPLRKRILHVAERGSVGEVCHLHALLGEVFASAVVHALKACKVPLKKVSLIGSHGQTVHHRPSPIKERGVGNVRSTLQIGDPNVIAERTGITTVSDFRSRDMAAGGEGAPLTPYAHAIVFKKKGVNRLVLNLGGIANITVLPGTGDGRKIRAFDIGPCNMLLDGLVDIHSRGRRRMDRGGQEAAKGNVNEKLLGWMLDHPYLARRPPKSTGREMFGTDYVRRVWNQARRWQLSLPDVLATSCRFIAQAVRDAQRWIPECIEDVVAGGGGVRNVRLWAELDDMMRPATFNSMEAWGSHSTAFEAQAFAILAYQRIRQVCANLPGVTGARHPVILGVVTSGRPTQSRS